MTTVQTRRASARQAAHRAKSDSDHLGALALSDGLSRDEEPLSRQANHAAIEARAGAAWSKATAGGGGEVPYRREMERAFGQDFSGVKAHVGRKAEMGEIQAKAATVGESVAFAESRPDKRLVAHELTHVVQNRRAKGGGGLRKKTSVSKPGDAAEVEADRMAERVVNGDAPHLVVGPSCRTSIHRSFDPDTDVSPQTGRRGVKNNAPASQGSGAKDYARLGYMKDGKPKRAAWVSKQSGKKISVYRWEVNAQGSATKMKRVGKTGAVHLEYGQRRRFKGVMYHLAFRQKKMKNGTWQFSPDPCWVKESMIRPSRNIPNKARRKLKGEVGETLHGDNTHALGTDVYKVQPKTDEDLGMKDGVLSKKGKHSPARHYCRRPYGLGLLLNVPKVPGTHVKGQRFGSKSDILPEGTSFRIAKGVSAKKRIVYEKDSDRKIGELWFVYGKAGTMRWGWVNLACIEKQT